MAIPQWLFPRSRSFWFGFTLPLEAVRLIFSKPILFFWSLFPVILSLVLYFYVIIYIQDWAKNAVYHYIMMWGLNPEGWMAWILFVLTKLILFVVGALTFTFVAGAIASPFNDFLAESTEKVKGLVVPEGATFFTFKVRIILIDLMKTLFAAAAGVAAILVSWIPVVNFFAFALTFLLVTFQYVSYPQTRRGQGIREGLWFLWQHMYACLGFGAVLSAMFALPFVSFLVIPLAVVGGTLLFEASQNTQKKLK
jgi:CysZ protein